MEAVSTANEFSAAAQQARQEEALAAARRRAKEAEARCKQLEAEVRRAGGRMPASKGTPPHTADRGCQSEMVHVETQVRKTRDY